MQPIGVFDSGLGGLTIVREIRRRLPHESIIYFGDLARLPYGIKSKQQIQAFSKWNTKFLMRRGVKAIVVACNSSSATSFDILKRCFSLPIIDVVQPAVDQASRLTRSGKVGVIATQATIISGIYPKRISSSGSKLKVYSVACPLFVPLVEEGWLEDKVTHAVISRYLKPLKAKGVDVLILGCTHYPLLKKQIQKFMGKKVKLVDSATPTTRNLAAILGDNCLNYPRKRRGSLKIFVSDRPQKFMKIGEKFLGEKLRGVEVIST